MFPKQINWEDGFAWCPDEPGLGVDIEIKEIENSIIEPSGFPPRLRREDGSITNW